MIAGDMAATSTASPPREPLRRARSQKYVGGVCAGLGRHLGVDPLVVRIAFVAAATAGGVGILLYAAAWVLIPADDAGERKTPARRIRRGRAAIEVAFGVGLLTLSVLLTMRAVGLWFSDAVVWPVVLLAAGGGLLWRQSLRPTQTEVAAPAVGTPAPEPPPEEVRRERNRVLSGTGLGVALVVGAGLFFLYATNSLTAARDAVLAALVVAVVLGIIFAPWAVRLVRSRDAEREERIRSQARAEMGAHLHDSVLQTLALVQKRADDPRAVAALARTQERELRAWLAGREGGHDRIAAALEAIAGEVERAHGVPVEVVVVGDRELDGRGEALVAAAREAMVNAAKFGAGSTVDVYAEADDGELQVYIRDRGPGFDPDAVPQDRRGVRESIVGRMARHGGRAVIHSAPGAGTEVELTLPEAP
jgi:signal transduction histidine kinase/phage shock protein PspC (stress-responsive transcriptional regulator)